MQQITEISNGKTVYEFEYSISVVCNDVSLGVFFGKNMTVLDIGNYYHIHLDGMHFSATNYYMKNFCGVMKELVIVK